MANTIQLEVVTPDRLVLSEPVTFCSLRGLAGELGVLPGHIPLFTALDPGLLHYRTQAGENKVITVMGGFLNVQPTKATVLADAAERAEDIDAARAKLAKERAEQQTSLVNGAAEQAALDRAIVRLKAVETLHARVGR